MTKYDVTWDSPSRDAWGTVPTGNGDIGLNVWVEESGDLLFYIGKTDLWDDNSRLLKLGRVRFRFSPNPYHQGGRFLQTLRLRDLCASTLLALAACSGAPTGAEKQHAERDTHQ